MEYSNKNFKRDEERISYHKSIEYQGMVNIGNYNYQEKLCWTIDDSCSKVVRVIRDDEEMVLHARAMKIELTCQSLEILGRCSST